jgi:glycosyltransferase involved in cell wall biosynthesis
VSINDWWKAGQTDVSLYGGFEDILCKVNIEYLTQHKINPVYQELSSIFTMGKTLDRIHFQQFDVHLNYNSLMSGYFAAEKLKHSGIKTIYDVADDLPTMVSSSPQIPVLLRPVGKLLGTIAFSRNVALADRVTIITESLRKSLGIPPPKAMILPNGVDVELFNRRNSPQLKKQLDLDGAFVLGYVGVLREWVDLEPVFVTVKNLYFEAPIKVLVLGAEGGLNKNKAIVEKYDLANRVVFTGTVPYSQLPEYISCMDACLIPFRDYPVSQNALPLKLFEYMACEKAVISTRLKGVVEVVQDRVMYASNSDELKIRVLELYNNEWLRKNMGAAGREFVKGRYSWASVCLELERLLVETVGDKR